MSPALTESSVAGFMKNCEISPSDNEMVAAPPKAADLGLAEIWSD